MIGSSLPKGRWGQGTMIKPLPFVLISRHQPYALTGIKLPLKGSCNAGDREVKAVWRCRLQI